MSGNGPEVMTVFCEALERLAANQRAAYLDEACSDDAELRARVEGLLRAHEASGNFLRGGPAAPVHEGPGTLIGPYKLLEQIGEGGFGIVFMAEQVRPMRRRVALKILKLGMDSRQVVARFEAERQALALMEHLNIARVLDAGETASGRPYFVMELVRGVPITEFCDQNELSARERLELFLSVCQGIQHAHQKGIIHRDLKPSNILVTLYDGTPVVKVIDFGIAKALGEQLTEKTLFTNFNQMIGTPRYMSPEQAEQSGLDVDTRTDIYALGVLLYELLTGTTPLEQERMRQASYDEVRRLIREEEPPRPSTRITTLGQAATLVSARRKSDPHRLSQLVRGELDWIVLKALEKDRTRRYDTASALAADVRRYQRDEPVLACPPSRWYRFRKFARRNKNPVLAASVLVLALVVGIIGTTLGMIRATDAEADAVNEAAQKDHALTGKETALSAARQSEQAATDQLFLSLLNQARTGRFSRQMGQRLDSLAALEKAARIHPDERLRDEAIAALALPDIRRGPSLHGIPTDTKGVAFDGRYQTYARIDDQGIISIRSIPDNVEMRSIETRTKSLRAFSLSKNGQVLALLDEHYALQIWRVADGKPLLREGPRPCLCLCVAFSPDSRQLAVAKDDCCLTIDLASGRETNRWRLPAKSHTLAFHPDNRRLAVGYSNSKVASIYDSAQGSHVADLPVGSMNDQVVAWHPDGARMAVAGSDPRIQIWEVAAKRKLVTLEGHVERVTILGFYPDGSLLASASWDGVLRLWDPATGLQLMQLPLAATPQFDSTGQWLGYLWQGNEQIQLLEVTPSREYRTIVSSLGAGEGPYHDGDISPDGRLLALGMGRAGDRLWELSSGRELAVLPSGSGCVLFQSDGRELFTCGDAGLHRWSIQESQGDAHELRLGPARKISLSVVPHRASRSPDGRTLAIVSETEGAGLLLDLTTESVQGKLFAHPKASEVALSRDGRWVASCGWHSDRVRLWNARTGIMIHEWVLGTETAVFFTPDSRALIICRGDAFTFWDVETLRPIRRLDKDVALYPGRVAFSPDGSLMALEMAPAVIHLKDVATGRTVAKLDDPHGDRSGWMGFTPDGTQLVVAAPYAKAIHIWDLRLVRRRLKEIGLDWIWPEFPPTDSKVKATELANVEVIPGDLAKPTREQKARQAIERCRLVFEANPDDAKACNDLGWVYVTAPETLRDVKTGLSLAEKAARLDAGNPLFRNTLGVAYYRAGRYREAVEVLRPNLDRQDDLALAFDLYFLAMSYHQLGETARARDYYVWARRWTSTQTGVWAGHLEELSMFQAEAEELFRQQSGSADHGRP
ncbi:MAG TPA: protein kinase [Pirellulales bacterium]|nr:protein kinase [Pirellulales bacterium]